MLEGIGLQRIVLCELDRFLRILEKNEVKTVLDLQEAASNTLAIDQFLKNAEEVAMPRIL